MRRWNGWGDDTIDYPLPESAAAILDEWVGPGMPPQDAKLEDVLASVPDSRLPPHPLITTEPLQRLRHARGQSFPDWLALRYGRIPAFPDGVARVTNDEEVRQIIQFARSTPREAA